MLHLYTPVFRRYTCIPPYTGVKSKRFSLTIKYFPISGSDLGTPPSTQRPYQLEQFRTDESNFFGRIFLAHFGIRLRTGSGLGSGRIFTKSWVFRRKKNCRNLHLYTPPCTGAHLYTRTGREVERMHLYTPPPPLPVEAPGSTCIGGQPGVRFFIFFISFSLLDRTTK